jgi:hypothetical protein
MYAWVLVAEASAGNMCPKRERLTGDEMRADDLVGVWMMQSVEFVDPATKQKTQPWGQKPRGTVMFHPAGRMFALLTASLGPSPSTESERAKAFDTMVAYSGHYRVDPPNVLVTTVDISWYGPWIGTEQVRYGELDGDELTLRSAPLDMPLEKTGVLAVVRWKRESGRTATAATSC